MPREIGIDSLMILNVSTIIKLIPDLTFDQGHIRSDKYVNVLSNRSPSIVDEPSQLLESIIQSAYVILSYSCTTMSMSQNRRC